jgi:hypothetical protein
LQNIAKLSIIGVFFHANLNLKGSYRDKEIFLEDPIFLKRGTDIDKVLGVKI